MFFAIHFLVITAVCFRDTLWLTTRSLTLLPISVAASATKGAIFITRALGQQSARTNLYRKALDLYLHAAGVESGYGFFSPNVGSSPKLIFELHFADGHVAYEPAGVGPNEGRLRFASFMDYVSRTQSQALRDILIRSLAQPIWQRHPDVVRIRAILGALSYPTPTELLNGTSASYDFVAAYDLPRPETSPTPKNP